MGGRAPVLSCSTAAAPRLPPTRRSRRTCSGLSANTAAALCMSFCAAKFHWIAYRCGRFRFHECRIGPGGGVGSHRKLENNPMHREQQALPAHNLHRLPVPAQHRSECLPLRDSRRRERAMTQGILIARRCAAAGRAPMHPAPGPVPHTRRSTREIRSRPRAAARRRRGVASRVSISQPPSTDKRISLRDMLHNARVKALTFQSRALRLRQPSTKFIAPRKSIFPTSTPLCRRIAYAVVMCKKTLGIVTCSR